MKILQFAYGHDAGNVNLPHFYTLDSVAYTGTHDNNTTRGWLESLSNGTAEQVRDYFRLGDSPSAWPVIRAALATVSRLAVIPIQDLLDLPALSALNQPGTAEGNWQWRYTDDQLSRLVAEKLETLRYWIKLYDRTGERMLRDYSEAPAKARAAQ
jgi:4-alpha-glucanotransferase